MSDEEKEAIEELKNKKADYFMMSDLTGKTLLNLIKKQSKEIEEYKKQLDLTMVYIDGFYDGEKKVEDKIKAKIEEVQNMKAKAKDIVFKSSLNYIETELQSLLERGENEFTRTPKTNNK